MSYESRLKNEEIDELFEAVLTLKDQEDCYRFFEDICTINELHAIAQRLHVAKLLSEKKTYAEIEALTKASTATISRINNASYTEPTVTDEFWKGSKKNKMADKFDLFVFRGFDPKTKHDPSFREQLIRRAAVVCGAEPEFAKTAPIRRTEKGKPYLRI